MRLKHLNNKIVESIMMYTWLRHANQLQKPERKFKFLKKSIKMGLSEEESKRD